MNRQDLIIGEYYFNDTGMSDVVFIFNGTIHSNSVKAKYYIQIIRRSRSCYFSDNVTISCNNIRLATPEEKHWLNKCIELNKFITKEEAMKSFIPEYVKLNKSQYGYHANDIAKIVENKNSGCILFVPNRVSTSFHKPNVYYSNSMFISSTKEEFEAQNKPVEPEFVLSKHWCIKRDAENWKIITDYLNNNYGRTYHQSNPNFPYVSNSRTNNNSKSTPHSNHQLITFEQFKKYVLKEEETKQPAKNAPIEEILEYCKKKYPIGTKFKVDYRPNLIYTVTGTLSKSSHMLNCIKDSKDSNPWIYQSGNYAEIVEESKQETSIKVEVKLDSRVYSLDEISKVINANYEKEDALEIIKTIKSIK